MPAPHGARAARGGGAKVLFRLKFYETDRAAAMIATGDSCRSRRPRAQQLSHNRRRLSQLAATLRAADCGHKKTRKKSGFRASREARNDCQSGVPTGIRTPVLTVKG
jgi:hypothetical protein